MLVALAAADLGSPLRQDGFSLRPPEGFRMVRMDLYHGTGAGAVAVDPGSPGYLSAALTDGEGPDAASLIVATVEESFDATPSMRDDFSTAVVRHFAEALETPMSLQRAELVRGPSPRIEVLGTVKQHDQVRSVLVAGMEGSGRHAVITFSVPTGRFEAMLPVLRQSLDSFRAEGAPAHQRSRSLAGAAAVLFALLLFASWSVWRRRRRLRRAELGLPG